MHLNIKRPWAFWRRVQYGASFTAFCSLVFLTIYFAFFYTPANCFDGVLNNDEVGVDCGGSCTLICAFTVVPPEVVWAESFKIVEGQYNAVAYVANKNKEAGTPTLAYTFRLFSGHEVIAERKGITVLPPDSTYPIFEGRVYTKDNLVPTKTEIVLEEAKTWLPATIGRSQFRTMGIELVSADARPRLNVKLENTELTSAKEVEVVATIFNQEGKPLTSSQTVIDEFSARTEKDIVFTWPNPIAKTVRSCEVPSDVMVVLDRSGSMAADGGTPPEPLESAKQSAKMFVNLLRQQDQAGYLSYATEPTKPIEQTLTSDFKLVSNSIQGTKMGVNGVQYTNMGDAFATALSELTSERHREDARKVIVFLTDGDVTRPLNPKTNKADREYAGKYAVDMANKAKEADVTIYAIGFGDFFSKAEAVERDVTLIKNLASSQETYYEAPTIKDLERVYKEIASDICEMGPARIDVITKTDANFAPLR